MERIPTCVLGGRLNARFVTNETGTQSHSGTAFPAP